MTGAGSSADDGRLQNTRPHSSFLQEAYFHNGLMALAPLFVPSLPNLLLACFCTELTWLWPTVWRGQREVPYERQRARGPCVGFAGGRAASAVMNA